MIYFRCINYPLVSYYLKIMPYCAVCHKAGQPEYVYTSHFVRQTPHKASLVTCPLILNNECKHCMKIGHFASGCPVLKQDARERRQELSNQKKRKFEQEEARAKEQQKVRQASNNLFDAFNDDSSDDEPKAPVQEGVVPKLESKRHFPRLMNWSAVDSDSEGED